MTTLIFLQEEEKKKAKEEEEQREYEEYLKLKESFIVEEEGVEEAMTEEEVCRAVSAARIPDSLPLAHCGCINYPSCILYPAKSTWLGEGRVCI